MSFVAVFLAGLLAGVVYATVRVQAPAPPIVALLGLLGMYLSQHLVRML